MIELLRMLQLKRHLKGKKKYLNAKQRKQIKGRKKGVSIRKTKKPKKKIIKGGYVSKDSGYDSEGYLKKWYSD